MISLIPPVAPPVTTGDVLRALGGRRKDAGASFASALGARLGFPHVAFFPSGRAAMAATLRAWAPPGRDEVVVPAYTCWSVPAAVVHAGLRVRLADVDPETLDFAPGALEGAAWSKTAVVVAAHLFGRTCDVSGVCRTVHARDPLVRVIDDSAQAWPGPGGSPADAVLLSFDRGKPLALGGGGALASREAAPAPGAPAAGGGLPDALRLIAAAILSHPRLFRLPASLPFLSLGATVYDPDFSEHGSLRVWQARLGAALAPRLGGFADAHRRHAEVLAGAVESAGGWRVPARARLGSPIRLPVLAPDGASRDRVVAALRRAGVAASAMYPGALDTIPALAPHLAVAGAAYPGATALGQRLLTLPVHPMMTPRDVSRVVDAFSEALGAGRRAP